MTVKPLVIFPDPLLRKNSEPIVSFNKDVLRLADDMLETMYHSFGIGLAGIQVAEPVRLLVIDIAGRDEPSNPQIFINPEIIWLSDECSVREEGCLSIPDYYAEVERPKKICARYLDCSGKSRKIEAHGLLATCLQHEIDHLNGVLFVDYLSRLKRDMVIRRFRKRSRNLDKGV